MRRFPVAPVVMANVSPLAASSSSSQPSTSQLRLSPSLQQQSAANVDQQLISFLQEHVADVGLEYDWQTSSQSVAAGDNRTFGETFGQSSSMRSSQPGTGRPTGARGTGNDSAMPFVQSSSLNDAAEYIAITPSSLLDTTTPPNVSISLQPDGSTAIEFGKTTKNLVKLEHGYKLEDFYGKSADSGKEAKEIAPAEKSEPVNSSDTVVKREDPGDSKELIQDSNTVVIKQEPVDILDCKPEPSDAVVKDEPGTTTSTVSVMPGSDEYTDIKSEPGISSVEDSQPASCSGANSDSRKGWQIVGLPENIRHR